jgi:hypothetical protein
MPSLASLAQQWQQLIALPPTFGQIWGIRKNEVRDAQCLVLAKRTGNVRSRTDQPRGAGTPVTLFVTPGKLGLAS